MTMTAGKSLVGILAGRLRRDPRRNLMWKICLCDLKHEEATTEKANFFLD